MSFDGSGVFNRLYNWQNDAANSIDITASRVDAEDTGFASGLSLCVTRDSQGKMAANFVPAADSLYDVGASGTKWKDLWFSGNLNGLVISSGTFTLTASSGLSTTPAVTVTWQRFGALITLLIPSITGTSNNNTLIMTGLPAAIRPTTTQSAGISGIVNVSTTEQGGGIEIQSGGNIILMRNGGIGNFSGTGTKGFFENLAVPYLLV